MKVGYVRASEEDQNLARQLAAMKTQNVEKVFSEKKSGKNTDREQLRAMLEFVREGDTVVTESISRIARNTRDLLSIVEMLTARKIEFVSLKESIDTTTPQGRFMLTVFGAMAELERESILQRQKEGIAIAKEEGKYRGRKPIEINREEFEAICKRWRAGEITGVEAASRSGLKKNTFYRRVKELGM